MTKRFSHSLKLLAHSSLLLLLITVGSMSHVTALGNMAPATNAANFCADVDQIQGRINARMESSRRELRDSWVQQTERLNLMAKQYAADTRSLEAQINAMRATNVTTMRTIYGHGDQKTAVLQYDVAMRDVIQQRRAAVDSAQSVYQKSVGTVVRDKQAMRAGQVEAYRITIDDAFRAAKVSCEESPDSTTAHATLKTQLETSRSVLRKSIEKDTASSYRLKSLRENRDASLQAATEQFNSRQSAAQTTLRAALLKP
jgi:hypothetical protein